MVALRASQEIVALDYLGFFWLWEYQTAVKGENKIIDFTFHALRH